MKVILVLEFSDEQKLKISKICRIVTSGGDNRKSFKDKAYIKVKNWGCRFKLDLVLILEEYSCS